MQSVVSWEQLLIILLVFLLGYYAVILFIFYRRDLSLLNFPPKKSGRSLAPNASPAAVPSLEAGSDTALYNSVHELMQDCKPVFQAAVNQQLGKAQVLEALRFRVQQYPQLKGSSFQIAVTNHFAQEMEHRLGMQLTDMEADDLWF